MNKVKRIIGAGLIFILPLVANAQLSYGVRGGLSYSSLTQRIDNVAESGSRMGFSVAGLALYQYHKHWGVLSELAFVNQGGSFYSSDGESGLKTIRNKYNYYSFQIPVQLTYLFTFSKVRVGIHAGPSLNFSLFGKMNSKYVETSIDFDKEKDMRRFDLGMNLGLFAEQHNVFFSINALGGLLDRNSDKLPKESNLYQNNVTFSIGYLFHAD